jgi:hypothetical protein
MSSLLDLDATWLAHIAKSTTPTMSSRDHKRNNLSHDNALAYYRLSWREV